MSIHSTLSALRFHEHWETWEAKVRIKMMSLAKICWVPSRFLSSCAKSHSYRCSKLVPFEADAPDESGVLCYFATKTTCFRCFLMSAFVLKKSITNGPQLHLISFWSGVDSRRKLPEARRVISRKTGSRSECSNLSIFSREALASAQVFGIHGISKFPHRTDGHTADHVFDTLCSTVLCTWCEHAAHGDAAHAVHSRSRWRSEKVGEFAVSGRCSGKSQSPPWSACT